MRENQRRSSDVTASVDLPSASRVGFRIPRLSRDGQSRRYCGESATGWVAALFGLSATLPPTETAFSQRVWPRIG